MSAFKVVKNRQGEYAIWPSDRENPLGWNDTGKSGDRAGCEKHIEEVWTDMRPLSLREKTQKHQEMESKISRESKG